jgi:cytoskeleton protein RodZ
MESETNYETFGSYLKDFRLKRELTIETVAARTKIAVHCLTAMEENAHDRLPPRAYVKSFIRAYADAVGANTDVAMNLYLTDLELQATTRLQLLKRQAKMSAIRRVSIAAAAIVAILLLVRYTDLFWDAAPPPAPEMRERTAAAVPSTADSRSGDRSQSGKAVADKLKLRVIAVEPTWLKIIVDGQNTRSYNLKPEDRLELEGTSNFNLMIGNAEGLKIFLNEQPVKIFGSGGQVVSLKIP